MVIMMMMMMMMMMMGAWLVADAADNLASD